MQIIPSLCVSNIKNAVEFYTNTLDFTLKYQHDFNEADTLIDLLNGEQELWLTKGDQKPRINIYLRVENIDELFQKYISRGLKIPNDPRSPVHNGPIDQSWGMREFYVNDPDGNTLRFGMEMGLAV